MQQRLSKLNEDFSRLHFAILNLLEQQEDLELEPAVLDDHEDKVGNLKVCLQHLVVQDKPAQEVQCINRPKKGSIQAFDAH